MKSASSIVPLCVSVETLDAVQDSLERIIAVADLLTCVGNGVDPSLLPQRTVGAAAFLISQEARRVANRLGARES